ncbi:MAG TPA: DUF924 family protein [Pseudoxanthomonas sp.]
MHGNGTEASEVVHFWRVSRSDWFSQVPAFDRRFRDRFLDLHLLAARGERDKWVDSSEGALALLILLDQFPRNAFRGTAHMYSTDFLARHWAQAAISVGHMEAVDSEMQLFFCLPFAHSEDLNDQEVSVALNARLGQPWHDHAKGHHDIIRRFGRFPHRNRLLGRETTHEEQVFLDRGGFGG